MSNFLGSVQFLVPDKVRDKEPVPLSQMLKGGKQK